MTAATISPDAEACLALVDQINAGTEYALTRVAEYTRVSVNPLEEVAELQVDVTIVDGLQLQEVLDAEDRSSHRIAIWIRDKLPNQSAEEIDKRALIVRQIFQRVNNFDSSDGRVKVWQVGEETQLTPDKELLRTAGLFVCVIILRVEVEAP